MAGLPGVEWDEMRRSLGGTLPVASFSGPARGECLLMSSTRTDAIDILYDKVNNPLEVERLHGRISPLIMSSSMQQRKAEILAKRAKLAELKRQRELRQHEFSQGKVSSGDGSEVRCSPFG